LLALQNANVLDPSGTRFLPDHHVLIEDGRTIAIGPGAAPPWTAQWRRHDLAGTYLLPGLIDSHFHLVSRSASQVDDSLVGFGQVEGVVNAAERLAAGVTAVRDCGCRHRGIFALQAAIESGLVRGPRTFAAGTNPTGPKAPPHWRNVVATGPESLRAAVRQQVADGADWVKLILSHAEDPTDWAAVTSYLTAEEISAAVDEAQSLGVPIGCHCEGADVAELAVLAGMHALEHAPLITDRVAELMAQRGVVYVPTVWAFSSDAGLDLATLPAARRDALRHWQDEHRASVARAHAAGVTIAAGSDAEGSLPARDVLVSELLALRDCGLSTVDLLAAATRVGAALIGHGEDLGVLRSGALADLIAVRENPLADITALRDPTLVVARGQVVRDGSGDELPESARASVVATNRWIG
jgi:imidazolonepropionase-like amidohydrolase